MAKQSKTDRVINYLTTQRGAREVESNSRRFRKFSRVGDGDFYFVGNAGSVRVGLSISSSISMSATVDRLMAKENAAQLDRDKAAKAASLTMQDYPTRLAAAVKEAEQAYTDSEFAAEADAGFDAGEFSGPAHNRMLEEKLESIAAKHSVQLGEIETAMAEAANAETPDHSGSGTCGWDSSPENEVTETTEDKVRSDIEQATLEPEDGEQEVS